MTLVEASLTILGRATTVPFLPMARQEVGNPTLWWGMELTRGLFLCSVMRFSKVLKRREKQLGKMKIIQ